MALSDFSIGTIDVPQLSSDPRKEKFVKLPNKISEKGQLSDQIIVNKDTVSSLEPGKTMGPTGYTTNVCLTNGRRFSVVGNPFEIAEALLKAPDETSIEHGCKCSHCGNKLDIVEGNNDTEKNSPLFHIQV